MYRTHLCNQLRKEHIGQSVTLAGWVNSRRDHGGVIFIDLRDREGLTQVVFRPEEQPQVATFSHGLRGEDVIQVTGIVAARLAGTENPKLATGDVEVVAGELAIFNKSEVPPFPLDSKIANEDLRLTYRYLDLRRAEMGQNLRTRHRVTKAARDFLDEAGFLEIETPILSNPTPEGARDFLVPSRLNPGSFYALPQAPQQYKQLLQVAGIERYFQIARCFRDEDLRADRQPEFTQIDIEASFVTPAEIQTLVEGMLARIFRESRGREIATPFPRMTFHEAMDRFGSDKPDTRFGVELIDLTDIFGLSQFKVFRSVADGGGVIKAINARGAATLLSKEQLKKWEEWVKSELGAKGLAYIRLKDGEWESPIVKFLGEQEKADLARRMDFKEGDVLFFGADRWEAACGSASPSFSGSRRTATLSIFCGLSIFPCSSLPPRRTAGWRCTIPSPGRTRRTLLSSRRATTEKCARWRTMWFSTGSSSAAVPSGSTSRRFRPGCSRSSGSGPRSSSGNLGICCGRSPLALRRMAALPLDWTVLRC